MSVKNQDIKTIEINYGKENAIKDKVHKGDFFYDEYKLALSIMEKMQKQFKFNENNSIETNNIISFIGDRGQGKSSAMRSFINLLKDSDEKIKDMEFEFTSKGFHYELIDTIDPSGFEDHNGVLSVLLAKMFNNIKDIVKEDASSYSNNEIQEITKCFEKVYEGVALIESKEIHNQHMRNHKSSLESIAATGDSTLLKNNMSKLVEKYLAMMTKTKGNKAQDSHKILIVPIDDLDTYLVKTYELLNEIQKYLLLPNVVLVMTFKLEQLQMSVTNYFENVSQHSFGSSECSGMATKFIDKIIPLSNRIILPSIKLMNHEKICVKYINYDFSSDESEELNMSPAGHIQKLFQDKMGYHLVIEDNDNFIIPDTLRGYISLYTLLFRLDDYIILDENNNLKMDYKIKLKNIDIFKHTYLKNSQFDDLSLEHEIFFKSLFPLEIEELLTSVSLQMYSYLETERDTDKGILNLEKNINYNNKNYGPNSNNISIILADFYKNIYMDDRVDLKNTISILNSYEYLIREKSSLILTSLIEMLISLKLFEMDTMYMINPSDVILNRIIGLYRFEIFHDVIGMSKISRNILRGQFGNWFQPEFEVTNNSYNLMGMKQYKNSNYALSRSKFEVTTEFIEENLVKSKTDSISLFTHNSLSPNLLANSVDLINDYRKNKHNNNFDVRKKELSISSFIFNLYYPNIFKADDNLGEEVLICYDAVKKNLSYKTKENICNLLFNINYNSTITKQIEMKVSNIHSGQQPSNEISDYFLNKSIEVNTTDIAKYDCALSMLLNGTVESDENKKLIDFCSLYLAIIISRRIEQEVINNDERKIITIEELIRSLNTIFANVGFRRYDKWLEIVEEANDAVDNAIVDKQDKIYLDIKKEISFIKEILRNHRKYLTSLEQKDREKLRESARNIKNMKVEE